MATTAAAPIWRSPFDLYARIADKLLPSSVLLLVSIASGHGTAENPLTLARLEDGRGLSAALAGRHATAAEHSTDESVRIGSEISGEFSDVA